MTEGRRWSGTTFSRCGPTTCTAWATTVSPWVSSRWPWCAASTTTYCWQTKPPPIRSPARSIGRPGSSPTAAGSCSRGSAWGSRHGRSPRLEPIGSELYDYSVLAILAEGDRETQATIADALTLDPSRLVALLDSLEAGDLDHTASAVRETTSSHVVSITATGRHELSRAHSAMIRSKLEDEFFAPLDAETRKAFHELLLRLVVQNDPSCAFSSPVASALTA